MRGRVELVGDRLQVREVFLGERKLALDGGAAVVGFEEAEQEPADRGLVAPATWTARRTVAQVVLDGGLRHERQEAALHREAPLQAHLTGGAAGAWPCSRSSVPARMPRAQRSENPATIASAITKFVPAAPSGWSIGTIPACSRT